MSERDCGICAIVSDPPLGGHVYEDDYFVATVHHGAAIPGWLILSLKRHELPITSRLNDGEAAALGTVLRRLVAVIAEATPAERVYSTLFGEGTPHWHMLLAARSANVAPEHLQVELLRNEATYVDLEQALQVADRIRAALAETSDG